MKEKNIEWEKNLKILLKNMNPVLEDKEYLYLTFSEEDFKKINIQEVKFFFREKEWITVILEKNNLYKNNDKIWSLITLQVHSSLDAIWFTAAFSEILKNNNISCNVVAGYFHDHIFVDKNDWENAVRILKNV